MAFANEHIEDKNYSYRAMPIESAIEAIVRNSSQFRTHVQEIMAAGEDISPADLFDAATAFGKVAEGVGTLGFGLPMVGAKKALEPLMYPLTEEDESRVESAAQSEEENEEEEEEEAQTSEASEDSADDSENEYPDDNETYDTEDVQDTESGTEAAAASIVSMSLVLVVYILCSA